MSDQKRKLRVIVDPPYPTTSSSDEDRPVKYKLRSSSPHSPHSPTDHKHKTLWAHGSGDVPGGSSSRGAIDTDGIQTQRPPGTGVSMVSRTPPVPVDPYPRTPSYYANEIRAGPRGSQLEVQRDPRSRSRSIGRMVKNEDSPDDDSPNRRLGNPRISRHHDQYSSRQLESDRLERDAGRDEDRVAPSSRTRDSSRRPSPYPDDQPDSRSREESDDGRKGRTGARGLATQVVMRGLSQVRSDAGSRRDDSPGPRDPPQADRSGVQSRQLVRTHGVSGPDGYGRYADYDYDDLDIDPRRSGLSVSIRGPDGDRRAQTSAPRPRYEDPRERSQDPRDQRGPYSYEIEKGGLDERRRGYNADDDPRDLQTSRRDLPGQAPHRAEDTHRPPRDSSPRDKREWKEVVYVRSRDSDEIRTGRGSVVASQRDEYDRRRLQPARGDDRGASPLPRHLEPGSWNRAPSVGTTRKKYHYPSDPRGGDDPTTDLGPTRELPSRSLPRSPEPPARSSVSGTSRGSGGRESGASVYGGSGFPYDRAQEVYEPPRQALPTPQLGQSSWELDLEKRAPPRARVSDGGSGDGRLSDLRSAGSTESTPPSGRDKGKRRADEVPTRPPSSRVPEIREREYYTSRPPLAEDRSKFPEQAPSPPVIILSRMEDTRKRDEVTDRESARSDAETAISLEKPPTRSTSGLDDWRTNALKKVNECSEDLDQQIKDLLRHEISGSKRSRTKGWGGTYKWGFAEGDGYFRDDRKEFVRATRSKMTEMVETAYSSYLNDGKNEIPPSNLSIQPSIRCSMNGKKSVSVLPSATITVGQWTKAAPIVKPKTFERRSRWSG